MAFTGRTRDEIRDELLTQWAALYTTAGKRLLTSPGSYAYLLASALGVQLEGLEAQAEQTARNILPDQAETDALNRFGYVYGIPRLSGVRATATVTVTGPVAGTITIPAGTQMVYSDGTVYDVTSADVLLAGGTPTGTINVRAAVAGTSGSRAVADVLTFVSAPSGLNTTGAVATVVDGSEEESDQHYSERIVERLRERPASGNRADWRAWVEDYTGTTIETAYVYPLLAPPASYPGTGTPDTLGTVTVVGVGPAQGDRLTNTRVVPYDDTNRTAGVELVNVTEYLLGQRAADGTDLPLDDGYRLPPMTMSVDDFSIEAIDETTPVDTLVTCVLPRTAPFEWPGSFVIFSSTTTSIVVTGNAAVANLKRALVYIGTGNTRGGYKQIVLPAGSYDGGTNRTTFTLSTALATAPTGNLYPGTSLWDAIRAAVFAYFDGLAPGDTSPASRWPADASSVMYRSALASAIVQAGALSATTSLPVADQTPNQKQVVVLGQFLITA